MQASNFWSYVIFGIVVLHFVIGIGYLAYKMSSKNTEGKADPEDQL